MELVFGLIGTVLLFGAIAWMVSSQARAVIRRIGTRALLVAVVVVVLYAIVKK